MHTLTLKRSPARRAAGLILSGLMLLGATACNAPRTPVVRTAPYVGPGWPKPDNFFTQVSYQTVQATIPTVEGAEMVNDDELCAQCHPAYAKTFAENVHRGDGCESCHGPASKHVEARGKEPGLIFNFKKAEPAVAAEMCLKCHEENQCTAGSRWRTSKHASCNVTCIDCHRAHYNVPAGTPATVEPGATTQWGPSQQKIALTAYAEQAANGAKNGQAKTAYKDSTKGGTLPSLKGSSNNLGAVSPGVCYRCHKDYQQFQAIAGPHQICGSNGFNCTTCHDPHGQILEYSRKDLCLSCHNGYPTMAWHSSIHEYNGVACTDCHNPHPCSKVLQFVEIDHYQVDRPKRLAMSVQEPQACYKCHERIYGRFAMPYHHPLPEGKMVCSDCHDPHGQYLDNLKEETVNLLCYKCHAEKQGPFAFEHPPVTERCTICHEPHGTVAKALLRKPATFVCLQCHAGHANNTHNNIAVGTGAGATRITPTQFQKASYTDCTHCHSQIHGSDRASVTGHGFFMR